MADKTIDKKIKESLMQATQTSAELKDEVWKDLEKKIHDRERGVTRMTAKKNKKKSFAKRITVLASAAAVLIAVFAVGTEQGQAAVKKIWEFLAPEKTITQDLEGMPEDTDMSLHVRDGKGNEQKDTEQQGDKGQAQKPAVGYTLYVDEERYTMEKKDGADRIVPINKPEGDLPEVYMEIRQVEDKTPEQIRTELEEQLAADFSSIRHIGQVDQPLKADLLLAETGTKWNDTARKYFLVDNGIGGTFVIEQQYFIEASEGHGARFDNMLKEFQIIDLNE